MTTEDRTLLGALTCGAVAVPAILGLTLGWPIWLWPLFIVVLLLVPFLIRRSILKRVHQERLQHEAYTQQAARVELAQAPPPPQFQTDTVANLPLRSAVDDYEFLFSATVYWRPIPNAAGWQHANPRALALAAVVARAEEVTVQEPPQSYAVAQYRLNSTLGTILGDGSGFVEACAMQVQLTLADADLTRLHKLADVRKDEDVWEHERHHERNKRAYLADDVFKHTGSAVVWWLARADPDIDVRGTVDLIDTLARLCAAANNTDVPELCPDEPAVPLDTTVAGRVRDLMDGLDLDEAARALFVRRLANAVSAGGRPDAAEDIVGEFDPTPPVTDAVPEQNGSWDGSDLSDPSPVDSSLGQ
jgi:hypothetical protein